MIELLGVTPVFAKKNLDILLYIFPHGMALFLNLGSSERRFFASQ